VTLNAFQKTYKPLIAALKTRRHLIRSIQWWFAKGCELYESDLLAILFDNPSSAETDTHSEEFSQDQLSKQHRSQVSRRPGLREFSFVGDGRSEWLLELVMSNLTTTALTMTTLTTLTLHFAYGLGAETYIVDLDRILATFPYLQNLSIDGWMHDYSPGSATDAVTTEVETHQYRLESLTFDPRLMCREGPDAFLVFRRLGNLKSINIKSLLSPYDCSQMSRPWTFGRALKENCPKLESVDTSGTVALWLYDLPVLWSSKFPYLTSSLGEVAASVQQADETPGGAAYETMTVEHLRRRLQEQELQELLEGKEAEPFFPQLKRLVIGLDHFLSFQDLISLGVQARFLTHLEICNEPHRRTCIWDMYEKDCPAATFTATTTGNVMNKGLLEARRLRKRRPFTNRDLMLFLQLCSSLQYFSLSGCSISFSDLIDSDSSSNSKIGTEVGAAVDKTPQCIRPWACEGTLQTLKLGLDMYTAPHHEQHALVWKHLGRLWKLRTLAFSSLSSLVASISYGVEGLLEGGMSETLEEVRSLPGWWRGEDRREMVLWFAKKCPKLMALGLEYISDANDGQEGFVLYHFPEDEDIKECSIHRVFIETC
jgi:hypothetical protein